MQRLNSTSIVGWLVGLGMVGAAGVIGFMVLRGIPSFSRPAAERSRLVPGAHPEPLAEGDAPPEAEPATGVNTTDARQRASSEPEPHRAASASAASPSARAARQDLLAGDLARDVVVPAYARLHLEGVVNVAAGATLRIDAGAEIVADEGSELVVRGRLVTSGTTADPVRFRGDEPGPGRWRGIHVIGADSELELRGVTISDADAAVTIGGEPSIEKTKFQIDDCLLRQNGTGIRLEGFAAIRVTNTAVIESRDDGISAPADDGAYTRVTLAGNGGTGYLCMGQPAPQFDSCTIVGNKRGGIHCGTSGQAFRGRWSVHRSNLFSNGPFDLFCEQPAGVIVTGNYWGPSATRELMALGDNARRKPRSRIWDGLHTRHRDSGIVLVTGSASEMIEGAGTDPEVLLMGGEPLDIARWAGTKRAAPPIEEAGVPEVPPAFADVARELRELLAARRYDDAARLLDESAADPNRRDVLELIREARRDLELLESFWTRAAQRMAELRPGDPASIGGIRGELVGYDGTEITIRVQGILRKSQFSELRPSDLIPLITSDNDPDAELATQVWLFLRADRNGSPKEVARWAATARQAGADLKPRGMYLLLKGEDRTGDDTRE